MQVRDVTGDGVPEVLFWSGYVGVINTIDEQHVIRYDESERRFRDVRRQSFWRGNWDDIGWVDVDERFQLRLPRFE